MADSTASQDSHNDPFEHDETSQRPPRSVRGMVKFLGPAFAVAAVTIGSGELVSTTAAGARAGIVALWLLIVSIIVKVGVQYQYAKFGLAAGKTAHEIFDLVPGKVLGHSWVWWWMVFFWVVINNLLYMGILLGAALTLHYITLQIVPISITLLIVLFMTIYPSLKGYDFVEDFATLAVSVLTITTLIAAIMSFFTPYSLSGGDILYGLSFQLPSNGVGALLSTIGTTGIAVTELVGYCMFVQKTGYGDYAGSRDTEGWSDRLYEWIKVMKIDVLVSATLILAVTIAFFIIGATVVAGQGQYPSGNQLAVYLAQSYGTLFGPIGYWVLMIGGFFAFYSTCFAQTGIVAVAWPDWISQTNWGEDLDQDRVTKAVTIIMPIVWYVGGFITDNITTLIIAAGVLFSFSYLPEIAATVWTLREEQDLPSKLQTTGLIRAIVVVSVAGSFIFLMSGYDSWRNATPSTTSIEITKPGTCEDELMPRSNKDNDR